MIPRSTFDRKWPDSTDEHAEHNATADEAWKLPSQDKGWNLAGELCLFEKSVCMQIYPHKSITISCQQSIFPTHSKIRWHAQIFCNTFRMYRFTFGHDEKDGKILGQSHRGLIPSAGTLKTCWIRSRHFTAMYYFDLFWFEWHPIIPMLNARWSPGRGFSIVWFVGWEMLWPSWTWRSGAIEC